MTRPLVLLAALVVLIGACRATPPASPSAEPSPSPTAPHTPPAVATPTPSVGFYLRAWYGQALAPPATFSWLPPVTISDGTFIDGNIAVPAIYPGPLLINPMARWISDAGVSAVVDEARRLGLLGKGTDFTGNTTMPGARTAHLSISVDGRERQLVGNAEVPVPCTLELCEAVPGTPEAFAAYWAQLGMLEDWLGDELGAPVPYQPERVALLLAPPEQPESGVTQPVMPWPLESTFTDLDARSPAVDGTTCITLEGDDLDAAFPVLRDANQLTAFVDTTGEARSAIGRVLVPGEASPCSE